MGIVLKQSLKNTLTTYVGFAIGAVNYLFLFTKFLTTEYFGLVGVILATASIIMPLLAFGVPNTLVKFYSDFEEKKNADSFLTLMLLLPFLLMSFFGVLVYLTQDAVGDLLAKKNAIVRDYVWYIFLIGIAMAYFEIFYSWAKVQMKSVFGNFMKEVFARMCTMILLFLVYYNTISIDFFLIALVVVYVLRMLCMKIYAFYLRYPVLNFNWSSNLKNVLSYTTLIIVGGSVAVVLLEIDKVMLNQLKTIDNVAYYGVAVNIAVVIGVPLRSMQQITSPLTAKLLNEKDTAKLKILYQKSSLTLFIASGILFLLIVLNVQELYQLLPQDYRGGFVVVFLIGLAKVYDALLGNNNAILYFSNYYRAVLLMGVMLAFLTILFNLWLIPVYGIEGAAMATFLAFFIFNTIKIIYVKLKFKLLPFTVATAKVLVLLLSIGIPFFYINFLFHPIVNILLKSFLMVVVYVFALYKFGVSEDVNSLINGFFKRK